MKLRRCDIILLAIAAFFILAGLILAIFVVGHDYIGYTCIFVGALIILYDYLHRLKGSGRHTKPAKLMQILVSVCLVIGCLYFSFLEILIAKDAKTDEHTTADYIVVLGAGVNGTTPSLSLRNRLEITREYLLSHPETVAVVSGGQGPGEDITEAECMYDWLISNGVDRSRILRETKATTTEENLKFSKEIIESQSDSTNPTVGIVSSEYHIHRAKLLAAQAGYTNVIGIAAPTSYFTLKINYSIREAFALTHFYVFGN